MRLIAADGSACHLTYCMNVHPGGTVEALEAAVEDTVLPLRARLGHPGPLGLGLRFDAATVQQLAGDERLVGRLRALFAAHDLVPFTANAFVLGAFHGTAVKEAVYAPSWATEERVRYTIDMARVLAALQPAPAPISLSTSPLAWPDGADVAQERREGVANLARVARALAAIAEEGGPRVRLAVEPEPGCLLERTDELVDLVTGPLAEAIGGDEGVRDVVGICFDVCHAAVVHEDVDASLDRLAEAGVAVVKVQASSALELADPTDEEARAALAAFDEPTYLHQVGAPDADGRVHVAPDLPDALGDDAWRARRPWRVHFHVPVFRERAVGGLGTTRTVLDRVLARVAAGGVCDHLEIETYTWDVIPAAEREAGSGFDLVGALEAEYRHVLDVLDAHGCRAAAEGVAP